MKMKSVLLIVSFLSVLSCAPHAFGMGVLGNEVDIDPTKVFSEVLEGAPKDNTVIRDMLAAIYRFINEQGTVAKKIKNGYANQFKTKYGISPTDIKTPADLDFSQYDILAKSFLTEVLSLIPSFKEKAQELKAAQSAESFDIIKTIYSLLFVARNGYGVYPDANVDLLKEADNNLSELEHEYSALNAVKEELKKGASSAPSYMHEWLDLMKTPVPSEDQWCLAGYCVSGTNLLLSLMSAAFTAVTGAAIFSAYKQAAVNAGLSQQVAALQARGTQREYLIMRLRPQERVNYAQ